MTLKQWFDATQPDVDDCGAQFGNNLGKPREPAPPIEFLPASLTGTMVYNFECSSTQWP